MGQRSRRRGAASERPRPSSAERSEQIRAGLAPLADGEHPPALLVAIAVAAVLGLINVALFVAGVKIQGKHPAPGVLAFSVVMAAAAWGMWRHRYWAVLGFQSLLALIVLAFALFLVRASNVLALAVSIAIIAAGGWLFWRMVRVLARIQMPSR